MKCVICFNIFESNYKQTKTCSKECSRSLKAITSQKWRLTNPDKMKVLREKDYQLNKDKMLIYQKERRKTLKGKANRAKQQRDRLKRDSFYKVQRAIRKRLWEFRDKLGTISSTEELGCSWEHLKNYLEVQFIDGMTWDNYGLHGWHIDHIVPLCSAGSVKELKLLAHYTNLQPLWAKDNLVKSKEDKKLKSDIKESCK